MTMTRARTIPTKTYWIRMEVDAEIYRPDEYIAGQTDFIRGGIHTVSADCMSESTLLALIEDAIHAEVAEGTKEDSPHAGQAAGASTCTVVVDSARRAADGAADAERKPETN